MEKHSIIFINKTDISVNISTWQPYIKYVNNRKIIFNDLSSYNSFISKKNESIKILSQTGEWIIDTYLREPEDLEEMIKAGYKKHGEIGKITDCPYSTGDYSLIYDDKFQILYDNGNATLIRKDIR